MRCQEAPYLKIPGGLNRHVAALSPDICYIAGLIRNLKTSHIQIISAIFLTQPIIAESGKFYQFPWYGQFKKIFWTLASLINWVRVAIFCDPSMIL
jgi:hypothetical protein